MKLIWLGTGGGRFVVLNQIRASGGWILEMDSEMIHVDPGPGALVRAKQYNVKLDKLTGVVVSHAHPDHYADAEMVIEAMTRGAKVKRGFILGSTTVFNGGNGFRSVISPYHAKAAENIHELKEGSKAIVGTNKLEIEAVKTEHGEPNCLGFVFRGSSVLGFSGDGEYYEGQSSNFKGCEYMLINTLRPRDVTWPQHMNADGARKLIDDVKPKKAILQHFGIKMMNGVAEREAKWITKETGIETIAAKDGMVFESDNNKKKEKDGINKFLK